MMRERIYVPDHVVNTDSGTQPMDHFKRYELEPDVEIERRCPNTPLPAGRVKRTIKDLVDMDRLAEAEAFFGV